jgi:RecJ-like exonuclease
MDCDVVVLDHHTVSRDSEKVVYANPHLEGIDGMTSGCGATMAFLFSVVMKEENWDLVQIAFAGMSGDRQTAKGVSGLNAHLLEGARKRGLVEEREGSLIPSGQLSSELFLGTDPYIRGVSGSVEGASQLLADAGIDSLRGSEDLDEEEERRLSSLIALKLTAQGVSVSTMEEIARTRYRLRDWGMDSEALASVLDACGRQGLGGIGVAAGMGDERSRVRAEELDREYRRRRVEEVRALEERGLTPMENIQFFDSSSSGLTGVLC